MIKKMIFWEREIPLRRVQPSAFGFRMSDLLILRPSHATDLFFKKEKKQLLSAQEEMPWYFSLKSSLINLNHGSIY